MVKEWIREIKKYCCLTNRWLSIKQIVRRYDFIGGGREIIPDPRIDCPFCLECYNKNIDCSWAKGTANSKNDPMVDSPPEQCK